ncbi:TonB-dependent receptor plug domain-containing protein [Pseudogemmobacter humi]|uniref:Vitamin B12 transporter BtuB n=1 Tax=Pseudogemmobacter humi TaxID=2483812 RepID=A0A3P5XAT1_9RHOB|nr:TonB-dependent receptor [Pseudogemmobacter humi]VDC31652.1 Vitamin B12 transporter BtuB precursor [Pseudogemmobacter humi]
MRPRISHIALIAALTAGGALAQGAEETVDLGTITLTALREAAETLRTGVSVTVVEAEDLRDAGDIRLSDYLSRLPGVSMVSSGPMGTRSSIRIRGAEPQYVAVYIDGIRVDDATEISPQFDFGALSTSDIARVEVLRGSQSSLWGGSAVGGVISITSLAPTEDGLSQTVAAEAGSYNSSALRYSLAFRDERVEAGFSLSHLKSDGFSAYDTLPRSPGLEDDGFEAVRLSFSARYRLSDALSLGAAVFAQRSENDFDAYMADSTVNSQERRDFGARLFAEYEAGNTSHLFDVTRYRISREIDEGGWLSSYLGVRQGVSYQGTTEINPALTLVYGAAWQEEEVTNPALPGGASTRTAGVFGQALWSPTEDLDLSLSLRQDDHSEFGGQPSGRLALAWQAADGLTLRGAASTGYRSPSHYELYGDPTWTIAANTGLNPEESRSLEIGGDYDFGGENRLSLTLFDIRIEDAITYQSCPYDPLTWACLPGTTNVYENEAGTSKRRGLELSGEARLSDSIGLSFAYTYVDASKPDGTRLLRVPRHSLAVTLSAALTADLSARIGVQHLAGRPAEFGTALADYTLVNAGLGYDLSESVAVSLRVENVFDEEYQSVPGYGTPGRAVYLGLTGRF